MNIFPSHLHAVFSSPRKEILATEKEELTLSQLCARFGISRRAIQGYEAHGLVQASGRTKRGYLLYDSAAQQTILKIRLFQEFGFPVSEIGNLFRLSKAELTERLKIQKGVLEQKYAKTEEIIQSLDTLLQELSEP